MRTQASGQADGDLSLHALWEDLTAILRRRKALVALVATTTLLVVYVGQMFVGDLFEAQASLLVRLGRENIEVPVSVEKGGLFPTGVRKEDVNSYIALLTSRPLLEATIREIGYERFRPELPRPETLFGWVKYAAKKSYRFLRTQVDELQILLALKRRLSAEELAYLALSRSLKVERGKDSDVIEMKLRLPDAGLARDVLQVLSDRYLARHVEVVRRDASVLQAFEQAVQTYGENLLNLRETAVRLKSDLGVSAVAEQKQQLLKMLEEAELGRMEAERERARNDAERSALLARRGQLEELQLSTQSMGPSAARARVRQTLGELQLERAVALSKYQPDADPVRHLEARIADLQTALAQTPSEEDGERTLVRNPALVFLETRLFEDEVRSQALAAVIEKSESQVASIKSELQRLDRAEAELQKLQVEISIAESRLLANAARREEARGQEALDRWKVANVTLLSPASAGEKPVAPNRLLFVAMGLAGGLVAGVVTALMLEWQGAVIHGPADLERHAPGLYLGSFTPVTAAAAAGGRSATKPSS